MNVRVTRWISVGVTGSLTVKVTGWVGVRITIRVKFDLHGGLVSQ